MKRKPKGVWKEFFILNFISKWHFSVIKLLRDFQFPLQYNGHKYDVPNLLRTSRTTTFEQLKNYNFWTEREQDA